MIAATLQSIIHITFNLVTLSLQPHVHVQIVQLCLRKSLKNSENMICDNFPKNVFRFAKLHALTGEVVLLSIGLISSTSL